MVKYLLNPNDTETMSKRLDVIKEEEFRDTFIDDLYLTLKRNNIEFKIRTHIINDKEVLSYKLCIKHEHELIYITDEKEIMGYICNLLRLPSMSHPLDFKFQVFASFPVKRTIYKVSHPHETFYIDVARMKRNKMYTLGTLVSEFFVNMNAKCVNRKVEEFTKRQYSKKNEISL